MYQLSTSYTFRIQSIHFFLLLNFMLSVSSSLYAQHKDSLANDLKIRTILNRVLIGDVMKWVNRELPPFELLDTDSTTITNYELKGKPTVLNFWTTNCEFCQSDIDQIVKLKTQFRDSVNFVVISIQDLSSTLDFVSHNPTDLMFLVEGRDFANELVQCKLPMTFILDKTTKVIDIKRWMPDDSEAESYPSPLCNPKELLHSLLKL